MAIQRAPMILKGGGVSIYHNPRGGNAMKTATFSTLVFAGACPSLCKHPRDRNAFHTNQRPTNHKEDNA